MQVYSGNGKWITADQLVKQSDAMRAKLQGVAVLSGVVVRRVEDATDFTIDWSLYRDFAHPALKG